MRVSPRRGVIVVLLVLGACGSSRGTGLVIPEGVTGTYAVCRSATQPCIPIRSGTVRHKTRVRVPSGTYRVQVTDSKGCTEAGTVTVTQGRFNEADIHYGNLC